MALRNFAITATSDFWGGRFCFSGRSDRPPASVSDAGVGFMDVEGFPLWSGWGLDATR